jgi:hypothetical protein
MGTGVSSLTVNRVNTAPSSAKAKNPWSYTLLSIHLHKTVLNKKSNKFASLIG